MFSVSVCSTERSEFLYIVGGGAGEKQGVNCLRLRPPQTLPVERLITTHKDEHGYVISRAVEFCTE